MADNVDTQTLDIDPSIPHDLVGKVCVLGKAHGVHSAAAAVVVVAAVVSIGVGEDDLRSARVDTRPGARARRPIVVPAAHILNCQRILIAVIVRRIHVERRRIIVPEQPRAFVAGILMHPNRLGCALIDVEHLAAILGHFARQHLSRADGPAAVRIVLIAHFLHLSHVIFADALVAALIEKNAGVVAVVDDGVAHQLDPLIPLPAFGIAFGIARRHRFDQAHAVARFDILLPRRDVHPANQVRIPIHHQFVA